MGTGGVGGFFGAHLARAGNEILFIARGRHLEALRSAGLRVKGPSHELLVSPVEAVEDPATGGPVDLVLFCVKLYDTESAARLVRPLLVGDTFLVSLQNGVDAVERLAPLLGAERVMAGTAYVSARIDSPGVIRYTGDMSWILFGEADGRRSERAVRFRDICIAAGFGADISSDIEKTLWTKFVLLATNAALSCLSRKPLGVVYGDPDLSALAVEAIAEAVAVGRAKGVDLDPEVVSQSVELARSLPADMFPSMYHDLMRGARLELESFSAYIMKLGNELGVPTPIHRTAWACLKSYREGSRPSRP